jgi:hypothetical protein
MDFDAEGRASAVLEKTNAITFCRFHSIPVRAGDNDAERHAYALATARLKAEDAIEFREDVVGAIDNQLTWAANLECPKYAALPDE